MDTQRKRSIGVALAWIVLQLVLLAVGVVTGNMALIAFIAGSMITAVALWYVATRWTKSMLSRMTGKVGEMADEVTEMADE